MDIQTAIDLPHYVNRNGSTELEKNTDAMSLKKPLEEKGHTITVKNLNSGLHGIMVTKDGLQGGADPRRVGDVVGK
jgi:gamma-glutamyltranspeptidase/glutathione hydrolase